MSERLGALHGRRALERGSEDERQGGSDYEGSDSPAEAFDGSEADYDGMPFERTGRMPAADGGVSGTSHCLGPNDDVGLQDSGVPELGKRELDARGLRCGPDLELMTQIPFHCWVHQFVRQVLASKTRFSYFVMRSISACRSGRDDITATALYPIPFPFEDAFGDGLGSSSKKRRRSKALHRRMHLTIMALNYEHFRHPMSILQLIRRRPSVAHKGVFNRIWMFFKASGPPAFVSVAGCGRKSFQLGARMREIVLALENLGLNPSSLYHHEAARKEVPMNNDVYEELRPYRPLDAARIKLTGTGSWECANYLSDLLYMPFVEPESIRFDIAPPSGSYPNVLEGDLEQVSKLCRVWDSRGLLRLIPTSLGPKNDQNLLHSKVFGNYKNVDTDRQIGDRRGRNFVEGRLLEGPSHDIPNATALLQLEVLRYKQVLVGAIADRRDFYHQFATTYERAATNTVFPEFCLGDFKDTRAYQKFQVDFGAPIKKDREEQGDFLGVPKPLLVPCDDSLPVFAAFGALFQGDHLGVEVACCAHATMLEEAGCHPSWNRLCASQSIVHNYPVTGLVIDDFFCLSSEGIDGAAGAVFKGENRSLEALACAKEAYQREKILGSDDKEISNALLYKIIGAEVNSTEEVARRGMVSLGSPAQKRFGLMMLSAIGANLAYTTDALHSSLIGSWISVLLYRRPMMAHMNRLFGVIDAKELNPEVPVLRPLSRGAAEEMLILACLGPLAASNIAVPFSDSLYASDASTLKGGLVKAEVGESLSRVLWRTANKNAKNPRLQSRTMALHRIRDESYEELDVDDFWPEDVPEVSRPIGLRFGFIEICGGAGVVTRALCELGVVCGPVLDISYSRRYDICDKRVFSWLAFMCEEGRLRSFLAAPPCTTFSPAAHPCLRTYKQPLGLDPRHPRVIHGNDMAFSCLGLLMVAKRTHTPGMMETPRRSKLRWTPQWKALRRLGADEVHLASCAYGSIHQKEFALITMSMDARRLGKRCSRDHRHIRIEGKFTKPSATYCHGLAVALARVFADHILVVEEAYEAFQEPRGLEDALSNEVLLSSPWEVVASWKWKGSAHINLLEMASALRAYEAEAIRGGDLRFVEMIDSHVALCALTRGRSSSGALRPLLKRASTLLLAYGLYQVGRFAPTRMNPADCPTRDQPLPEPTCPAFEGASDVELRWIASLSKMRRWISNWARLCLLLCPSWLQFFTDTSSCRRYGHLTALSLPDFMDFDSTLGFPGEGWFSPLVGLIFVLSRLDVAGAVGASHGDALRREQRVGIELPEGRRVTQLTSSIRAQLGAAFNCWLREQGLDYDSIFQANPPDLDKVNQILTRYGRFLFSSGKPYYHLSETINLVSARRPILRRSLQQAWDLCAMWSSFEPVEHHRAMPAQVLLGVLATCLVWGWTREAAFFAMCWGMLLRPGELLTAYRRDVVFPQDVRYSVDHVLLRILEPKTRFRAARHQSSKLEPPDLIYVAWMGIGRLKPYEKIWPSSPSTLRRRLDKVLSVLGLPTRVENFKKPLTLASFRPGGATFLIGLTESAELVRRRGRWVSLKVMDIYLQEVSATTFLTECSNEAQHKILTAMESFPVVLQESGRFFESEIPEKVWNFLFKHAAQGVETTEGIGRDGSTKAK